MNRFALTLGGGLAICVAGVAQQPERPASKPAGPRPQAAQIQPASRADLALVLNELDRAASKKLGVSYTEYKGGSGAVTRDEVVALLANLFAKYKPKFRVTPRPGDVYPAVIDQYNKDPKTRETLKMFSKWMVVSPVGPLAAGKTAQIGEEELGDALGYFYSRIMVYTHQPDPKWTPSIQGG